MENILSRKKIFALRKNQCLNHKRDKSSAGKIDPRAIEICTVINQREEFYTTSSCSGRCFLYCGEGNKSHRHSYQMTSSTHQKIPIRSDYEFNKDNHIHVSPFAEQEEHVEGVHVEEEHVEEEEHFKHFENNLNRQEEQQQPQSFFFQRFRVCHDLISDSREYFNLHTLRLEKGNDDHEEQEYSKEEALSTNTDFTMKDHGPIWLRYEPFILHVMCRSLSAASALMNSARPAFKNVALTSWKEYDQQQKQEYELETVQVFPNKNTVQNKNNYYVVAIWGDEGLDMPLTSPMNSALNVFQGQEEWLMTLVNERHVRNWNKMSRFVTHVLNLPPIIDLWDDIIGPCFHQSDYNNKNHEEQTFFLDSTATTTDSQRVKSFDIIGDVAIIHSSTTVVDPYKYHEIGQEILKRNKAIRIVALRQASLSGIQRSIGQGGLSIIAGVQNRSPLITTHTEYGIKCIVDLHHTFFSPRMTQERYRITNQVVRDEHVLVLFCGVGMEALLIAGKTEAAHILAIDINPTAIHCAQLGRNLLKRNKTVKYPSTIEKLEFLQADAVEIMKTLESESFDRIIAPRPKELKPYQEALFLDGEESSTNDDENHADVEQEKFLLALMPLLNKNKGVVHWYDFASDYPDCVRTLSTIRKMCNKLGKGGEIEVVHVSHVGSVAKRQARICVDFRILYPQRKN